MILIIILVGWLQVEPNVLRNVQLKPKVSRGWFYLSVSKVGMVIFIFQGYLYISKYNYKG